MSWSASGSEVAEAVELEVLATPKRAVSIVIGYSRPSGYKGHMSMRQLPVLLLLAASACSTKPDAEGSQVRIVDTFDPKDMASADAKVLAQLQNAGADLRKPTHFIHHLYFRTREGAEAARAQLGEYSNGPVKTMEGEWPFYFDAETHAVPSPANVAAARRRFEQVAAGTNGTYDGWEAAVTP